MATIGTNPSGVFEPNSGTDNFSVKMNINAVVIDSSETKSDLFYGYIWPGVLTMVMCFIGASTNVFHV